MKVEKNTMEPQIMLHDIILRTEGDKTHLYDPYIDEWLVIDSPDRARLRKSGFVYLGSLNIKQNKDIRPGRLSLREHIRGFRLAPNIPFICALQDGERIEGFVPRFVEGSLLVRMMAKPNQYVVEADKGMLKVKNGPTRGGEILGGPIRHQERRWLPDKETMWHIQSQGYDFVLGPRIARVYKDISMAPKQDFLWL